MLQSIIYCRQIPYTCFLKEKSTFLAIVCNWWDFVVYKKVKKKCNPLILDQYKGGVNVHFLRSWYPTFRGFHHITNTIHQWTWPPESARILTWSIRRTHESSLINSHAHNWVIDKNWTGDKFSGQFSKMIFLIGTRSVSLS